MGFYPIKKAKIGAESIESSVGFLRNQKTFDNFIMSLNKEEAELDCIFFDWTMGKGKGQDKNYTSDFKDYINKLEKSML